MTTKIGTPGNDYLVGADGETNIIYGDTDGVMGSSTTGGNDILIGGAHSPLNEIYGDGRIMSNAIGGSDTLTGGIDSINRLAGDAFEMVASMGGNDTITGGAGQSINYILGDAWIMLSSRGGNDTLTGGEAVGGNLIYGDGAFMESSIGGDDVITGGAAASNTLYGDADAMSSSTGGNDIIIGGALASNLLVGDANQTSQGHSTGGNDTLIGGIGGVGDSNTMVGDFAYVYAGADVQGGDDRLISAANTPDNMWGDFQNIVGGTVTGGHDTFVFSPSNGNDIIHDFHQGEDAIELDGFLNVPMSKNGAAHMSLRAASQLLGMNIETVDANHDGIADSVIHFDASDSVTVLGVAHLTAGDFMFSASSPATNASTQQLVQMMATFGADNSAMGTNSANVPTASITTSDWLAPPAAHA